MAQTRPATFDIVLATANAKYHHASLALRCLLANLGELRARATFVEFTLADSAADQVESILRLGPRIVGLSVYVWNVERLTEVVAVFKAIDPAVIVVLGGPEVSHGLDGLRIAELADYVVQGEGEVALRELCGVLLAGERPDRRVLAGGLPELSALEAPYSLYTDEDLRQRTLYVEASRGCPYRCEFCLSSLDLAVRHFPLEPLLTELQRLIDRGARNFKFIDRTFNLKIEISAAILDFFLERHVDGRLLHFELVPDRLPVELRSRIARFPAGSLQFEVGVQSLDDAVGQRISRRQNLVKMADNFRFLRDETHTHVHADLIIGLPGEGLESFGAGLDRLFAMGPQEIQVGILKRLRGAPIARHDAEWSMIYSQTPPYEVLSTGALDFATLQRLKRFAFVWDRLVNRGQLQATAPLLWGEGGPFYPVLRFSDRLYAENGQVHAVALDRLAALLVSVLLGDGVAEARVKQSIELDYRRAERNFPASVARRFSPVEGPRERARDEDRHRRRQLRHIEGDPTGSD